MPPPRLAARGSAWLLLAGLARGGVAVAATTIRVGPMLDPDAPPVAPNFVGLSIEVPAVLHMIGEAGGSNGLATLLAHFYDLTAGPHAGPTLRFGGNSADDSAWLPGAAGGPLPEGISYAISEKDLDAYATFAGQTAAKANISIIIDTNFGTSA
eukprot:SAG31_NODE_8736_length_1397_cov_1.622496_2_plen_153_part_01